MASKGAPPWHTERQDLPCIKHYEASQTHLLPLLSKSESLDSVHQLKLSSGETGKSEDCSWIEGIDYGHSNVSGWD